VIRSVVFDFDGTLVLSNAVKVDSFYEIAEGFPHGRVLIETILAAQPGDRTAIWSRFAAELRLTEQTADLIDRYTRVCHARIQACPVRAGAEQTLQTLRHRGCRLSVNSSTPVEALRPIVETRFPVGMFADVCGEHGRKLENLRSICAAARLQPTEVIMVGDGVDDLHAAQVLGCRFVGVSGGTLSAAAPGPLIDDLRELLPLFDADKDDLRS
jgi:phosphoglycolate phosphatase-like HAD superfamily hydrolase